MSEYLPSTVNSIETLYRAKINYIKPPGKVFGIPAGNSWEQVDTPTLEDIDHLIKESSIQTLGWIDFFARVAVKMHYPDTNTEEVLYSRDRPLHKLGLVATERYRVAKIDSLLEERTLPLYLSDWLTRFMYADRPIANLGRKRSQSLGALMLIIPDSAKQPLDVLEGSVEWPTRHWESTKSDSVYKLEV